MNTKASLPVAIIGAGPVGLAAAAHLYSRHQPFIILEAGDTVAANILSWKHIRVFSPWKYNVDTVARQLLETIHWTMPEADALPTGAELYEHYLKPLADTPFIKPHLYLRTKVITVGRKGIDKTKTWAREEAPYSIQAVRDGKVVQLEAKAMIDTSGTWASPNPLGANGNYASGETARRENIFYGIPDILHEQQDRYRSKSVLVVGSGHSAINVILELDKLKAIYPDTQIHWVLRKKSVHEVYGGQAKDALAARGALGIRIEELVAEDRVNVYTPFYIQQVVREDDKLSVIGLQNDMQFKIPGIDEIICNTGSRPDFSFLREVRLSVDPALESSAAIASLIDPNIHSCGTVRPHGEKELRHADRDFYIAGSKSYGRAPTFLMATGYEQVRSIAAAIAGDYEAAQKVELNLPETGVCKSDAVSSCCN
jgi:thioredoxin reductase